jgi:glycine oxidase
LAADYLIIGGGVIGCATALELSRRGARVSILERGELGRESSWAGGGILFPLLPWDYKPSVTALVMHSLGLYGDWIAALQADTGINPQYVVSGMLVLPEFDGARAAKWCAAHGVELQRVKAASLLDSPRGEEALWLPGVAQVRNPRLMQALRLCLVGRGVKLVEYAEVQAFETRKDMVAAVTTSRGKFSADGFVIAAGAWSSQVLGGMARGLPIVPIRGQMLLYRVDPGTLGQIVLKNGIYLIPRMDGHILVGSTLEESGFDKGTTAGAHDQLRGAASEILPALKNLKPIMHWAGLRPGSPDNIPVIDRHPGFSNLYLNAGQFRYGVTMAPASAQLLANLIDGRTQPIDPSPYGFPAG